MLVPKGVEEALFKRVGDGWIFSAPNPWTFGRRHSYLVNDAQKAALGMRVRRGRYRRILALIPMFCLPLAAFLLAPSLLRAPSITTWALFALFVVVGPGGPLARQEGDLEQRERIDVRIAQSDRRLQHGRVAKEMPGLPDAKHGVHGARELRLELREQYEVTAEMPHLHPTMSELLARVRALLRRRQASVIRC